MCVYSVNENYSFMFMSGLFSIFYETYFDTNAYLSNTTA